VLVSVALHALCFPKFLRNVRKHDPIQRNTPEYFYTRILFRSAFSYIFFRITCSRAVHTAVLGLGDYVNVQKAAQVAQIQTRLVAENVLGHFEKA
jgi:hypothetical protein